MNEVIAALIAYIINRYGWDTFMLHFVRQVGILFQYLTDSARVLAVFYGAHVDVVA